MNNKELNLPEWAREIEERVEQKIAHAPDRAALLSALSEYREALEKYANTGNWQPWPFDKGYTQCCIDWTIAEKALQYNPTQKKEGE